MSDEIRFDIIVPLHNITYTDLQKCLSSIDKQTYEKYNVWVIESQQSVKNKLDEYDSLGETNRHITESFGNHFNYLIQSGKGLAQARNQAAALGDAPFIAFLDGDDMWLEDHLNLIQSEIMFADEDYIAWWGDYLISKPMHSLMTGETFNSYIKYGDHSEYHLFRSEDWYYFQLPVVIFPSSLIVRRTAFEWIEGFNEEWLLNEDSLFLNTISRRGKGQYVEGAGSIGTLSVAETKIDEYDSLKDDYFNRIQELTVWPDWENKPEGVDDTYWAFVIDFVNERWKKPYEFIGI